MVFTGNAFGLYREARASGLLSWRPLLSPGSIIVDQLIDVNSKFSCNFVYSISIIIMCEKM